MSIDEKPQKGVTRRTFLKGAVLGAAGVAAGGMLAGCGGNEETKEPSSSASNGTSEPSFLTPPDPIPESEIKETVEADVVVVGAGLSGCCAALSAAEEGAKVVLLEKTDNVNFRGIDYGAIGSKMQKSIGNEIDKMKAVQEIMRYNAYKGDQRVISLWANNSGSVADWIMEKAEKVGCKPVAVPIAETTTPGSKLEVFGTLSFRIEPNEEALTYVPKGSDPYLAGLVYTFKKNVENDSNIDLRYNTPAVQLVREENGPVTGVIAGEEGNYTKFVGKKGVILCTGDYGGDKEMREYFIPSSKIIHMNMYEMVHGNINTGDGHKMGMWVGAAIDEAPHAPMYFDFAVIDAPILADALMRQPWLGVNVRGERYANEELPYSFICNAMRQQPEHCKWAVWDAKWPEEAPKFNLVACKDMRSSFHNPDNVEAYIEKGYIRSADTLEELAEKMEVPVDTFLKTVERYNELAKKGVDEDFGKRPECMTTIEKAPFYAAPLGISLLVTLGGLQVNDKLQVLDKEKNVIPGLYAAGNASGCYYANDYCVNLPGNSHGRAFTFGYLAGKNVVSQG
ncbi:MAG: FAD-binding protein [Syntrophomonadaceae bacterium]|jgi:fumarate reductase flavoprotein subunit|nr:FAD-dependent oxidoreductase [Thermoanaerobacterales bacterium]NLN22037.1 FAD-binding protein [Syntrophomonadaceae bacterium]